MYNSFYHSQTSIYSYIIATNKLVKASTFSYTKSRMSISFIKDYKDVGKNPPLYCHTKKNASTVPLGLNAHTSQQLALYIADRVAWALILGKCSRNV